MNEATQTIRRSWERFLDAAGELSASGLIFAMRILAPEKAAPLPDGPLRVLVVAAHPDDESGMAGGAIAAHARRGDEVVAIIVTSGARSRAGGLAPDEMAARRAIELQNATTALGVSRLCALRLKEFDWDPDDARAVITEEAGRADIVYSHGPADFHPDHMKVSRLVSEIVRDNQRVRLCEAQVLLTPLLANVCVSLAQSDRAARDAALAAHATQHATLLALMRKWRLVLRAYGRRDLEFFWELDGAAYRRVIAASPWIDTTTGNTPFWGVRPRGASDLRAVLRGTVARLRLRRAAHATRLRL